MIAVTLWELAVVILLTTLLTGAIALGGVFLGGWLVFRTKRESYEALTGKRNEPLGDAVVLDDLAGGAPTVAAHTEDAAEAALNRMEQENLRFLRALNRGGKEAADG